MRKTALFLAATVFMLTGCTDSNQNAKKRSADPTFLIGCFREEITSDTFRIPEMTTPQAAAYLQQVVKTVPGHVDSQADLQNRTLTVRYKSTIVRKMNFEEAIALVGFSVNNRPANPQAKIPAGVK